jgi:chemotaxis protein methyltransferase CheR
VSDPAALLAAASGLRLQDYRREHVAVRVERALERERSEGAADLACLLNRDAAARDRFRRSVAVTVSGMFRDPAQFELLEQELLPSLVAQHKRLRVWSAGCADGSELASVAIVLDRLGALERGFLLGSDVLEENIAKARELASADPRLAARLRWEVRDLLAGPPVGRWHLILCRNVAIYLAPAAKLALHRSLADVLAPGGVLLLGRSERIERPELLGLERAGGHAYRRRSR